MKKVHFQIIFWLLIGIVAYMVIASCASVKPITRTWCDDTKAGAKVTTIKGMRNTDRTTVLHPGCDCKQLTDK